MAIQLPAGMETVLDGRVLGGFMIADGDGPVVSPTAKVETRENPPARVDLRGMATPVENQGQLPSCCANAMVGALEFFINVKNKGKGFTELSRMFVWYNARHMWGAANEITGSTPEYTMAAIMAHGACSETDWPYMPALALKKPHEAAFENAQKVAGIEYARIDGGDKALMLTLARGLPIFFGAAFPRDIWRASASDGWMPLPQGNWPEPGGGHAMLLMGYDLPKRYWIMRNSWGTEVGDNGYFYVPFDVFNYYSTQHYEKIGRQTPYWAIGDISMHDDLKVTGELHLPGFELPTLQGGMPSPVSAGASSGFPSGLKGPSAPTGPGAGGGYDKGPGAGGGYDSEPNPDDLDGRLDKSRRGFRDRLREKDGGPGAGGGYDKGPGAGGGYDD